MFSRHGDQSAIPLSAGAGVGAIGIDPQDGPESWWGDGLRGWALMQTFFKADLPSRHETAKQRKKCEHCDKPLAPRKPSQMAKARFCSTRCAYDAKRSTNPTRQVPCVVCGKATGVSGRPPGQRKTCSAKCGYELRKRTTRPQRSCNHCGEMYWPQGSFRVKFCSRKCYIADIGTRRAMLTATCMECGSKFKRTAAALKRVRHAFCGNACVRKFFVGEKSPMFRGDKDPNRGAAWNRRAEAIRERDGYSCRRCGLCQTGNGQKLSVDHVKPWRSFEDKDAANHPSNLVSLCRSCHNFKTSTVERAWLRGDRVAYLQWVRSLHLKSAVKGISVEQDASGKWVVRKQYPLAEEIAVRVVRKD